jgi:hypothetical protein
VLRCYKRFDASFTGAQENKSASSATVSYGVDTNWYTDTRTTDHITGELEKITVRDKYSSHDQVHTASGAAMEIDQIGHSLVHTPSHPLHLNHVLYVRKANKNLVSVHRLTSDNHAFLEFHPNHFLSRIRQQRKFSLERTVRVASIL